MRRLLAAHRRAGVAALAHGNRGRGPAHALAEGIRKRVVALAQGPCRWFNHYQLLPGLDCPSYAHARVEVQERLDGALVVRYQGKALAARPAPPARPRPSNGARPHIPAPDHLWRKPLAVTKSLDR